MARLAEAAFCTADLKRAASFWEGVLGLEVVSQSESELVVGPGGGDFQFRFVLDVNATPRPQPTVGLYHVAMLVPDRQALGAIWHRLNEAGWPLEGMSDHAVSEAIYLRDPDNNGIEIYRDRPVEQWPRTSEGVAMTLDPIDAKGILEAASTATPIHPATVFGHIHMAVQDLDSAEAFYRVTLGMDLTQRLGAGARFFSVDGYHHHVATNVWASGNLAPQGSTGLVSYTWRATSQELDRIGVDELVDPTGAALKVRKP